MPRDRETYSYVEEWRRRWEPELEAIAFNGATCDPTRVDPKVLHWVKQQRLDKKPHFVKIINACAANGRPGLLPKNSCCLTVPAPFARKHYRQLERVVTLETTTTTASNEGGGGVRKWRVSFGTPTREPLWGQGWQRVAADNNLQVGDVVVFVLVEPSRFQFTHFDADGNLKKLSVSRQGKSKLEAGRCSSQESHGDEAQLRDDDATKKRKKNLKRPLVERAKGPISTAVNNVPDATQEMRKRALLERANGSMSPSDEQVARPVAVPFPAGKTTAETSSKERRKLGKSNSEGLNHDGDNNPVAVRKIVDSSFDPLAFEIKSQRRATTVVEKERAKRAAMAHAQALTDPYFVTILSDAHVYHDFHLVVPESFATEAGWTTSRATAVKLEDGQGECWDLLVKKNSFREVAFHRKLWALFALHHLLEEGDVCVFYRTRSSSPRACKCTKQQVEHLRVHMVRVVPLTAHPLPLQYHYALQMKAPVIHAAN